MITAKQLFGSAVHVQLRYYIWQTMPEADDFKKAAALGSLVKKFITNANNFKMWGDEVPRNIDHGFVWADTPEGYEFWSDIHNGYKPPQPFINQWFREPRPIKQPQLEAVKPRRVGWWQ